MAYTHRHYSTKDQFTVILNSPKVLGEDLSEFVERTKEIMACKSLIKKVKDTYKLKKDYWNKVTELYANKIKEMNLEPNPSYTKVDSVLSSYHKFCTVFNKDIFAYERMLDNVSPRLIKGSEGRDF